MEDKINQDLSKFRNSTFFLGIAVSVLSAFSLVVFTGLFYPKVLELKKMEELTFVVHREVEWILFFSGFTFESSRLLSLPILIFVFVWGIRPLRKKFNKVLIWVTCIYSVVVLMLSILVASGVWMFSHYTTEELWHKQLAYSRMAEQFAIEEYSEEKYQEIKKVLAQSYGMKLIEVDSPDELERTGRRKKYEDFLRILEDSPNVSMKKKTLVTLMKFKEDLRQDQDGSRLFVSEIQKISNQNFEDFQSAFDWLKITADEENWKSIPIMGFEYRPPKEM